MLIKSQTCIDMINTFDMDSTQDIFYLKVQKNLWNLLFFYLDKFNVVNSKAPFFASVVLDSAWGHGFLSKPLFRDRLMVLYPPWNYWNPANTPFSNRYYKINEIFLQKCTKFINEIQFSSEIQRRRFKWIFLSFQN